VAILSNLNFLSYREVKGILLYTETEFKEFERRLKFKPRLKYGWFHLKMFQDLGRRSIETGFFSD